MATKEQPVVKAYGAYSLLRQAGDDMERDFKNDFYPVYREFIAVALIDAVNGHHYDNNCQELYENSVLSLWFPGLDLSEKNLDEHKKWIALPERKEKLLLFMRECVSIGTPTLTNGEFDTADDYELWRIYKDVQRDRNGRYRSEYGDCLIELLSKAYYNRLEDDVRFAAREDEMSYGYEDEPEDEDEDAEYEDDELYDVDMDLFMKDASSVSIICTPTAVSLSPVPERLANFLSETNTGHSLSLYNDMKSF